MKPPPALVILSSLVLLAACLLQLLFGPSPTVRPTLPAPRATQTSLPPTLTPKPSSTLTTRWTPRPAITPTPYVDGQPLESPATSDTPVAPAWANWQARYQDWFTVPDSRVWIVGDRGVAVYDPKGKQP